MQLTLQRIEKMCRRAGMKPEKRERIGDYVVFIADGFSSRPHITFQRFGVTKDDFRFGCYGTIWFLAEDETVKVGGPMFFDAFHDSEEGWTPDLKKRARVNAAMEKAREFLNIGREAVGAN